MRRVLMIAILSMLTMPVWADEPKATTEVLQERLEKIAWQMKAYQYEFKNLADAQKEIQVELDKRKTDEAKAKADKADAEAKVKPSEPAK